MNKEYIKPIISVYEMKPTSQLMLNGSLQDKDANGPALGKDGGNYWDDDEPEEAGW